jgi:hypothetical protein
LIFVFPVAKVELFLQSPKILRTFALASLPYLHGGGQLHIERRYLRFVFDFSELRNF